MSVYGTDSIISGNDAFLGNWTEIQLSRIAARLHIKFTVDRADLPTRSGLLVKRTLVTCAELSCFVTPYTHSDIVLVLEYQPVVHRIYQIGIPLDPTNPTSTNVAWETSDFRPWGFSPQSRYSYRHSHSRQLHLALQRYFTVIGTLPYHTRPQGENNQCHQFPMPPISQWKSESLLQLVFIGLLEIGLLGYSCAKHKLSLLVSKRFQELLTGSFTLLFHLSLTVLVHYR